MSSGSWIAIGIAIGVAIGAIWDSIGIAVGIALGAGIGGAMHAYAYAGDAKSTRQGREEESASEAEARSEKGPQDYR